jgi:protein-glutamine gamma-glutamyltransferase
MTPVDRYFEMAIVGMLASGYAGILGSGFLDLPTALLAGCALFVRMVQLAAGFEASVSSRLVNGLTSAYIIFFAADWAWLSETFLEALVHLLFFLAILRLFTARTRRDYLSLQLIAFLEMIAAAILSASTTFFAALIAFMIFAVAALAGTEMRRSLAKATRIARVDSGRISLRLWAMTASIAIGVLVLTAGLFFLLPRTARAAFLHFIPDRYQVPGFSNTVELGRFGDFKRLDTPVLHVRPMPDSAPLPLMRWRGASLRDFDGKRWTNPHTFTEALRPERSLLIRLADNEQRWRHGTRVSYEVRLHAVASNVLFVGGTPEFLQLDSGAVVRTNEGVLRADFDPQRGLRYGVWSFVEESAKPLPGELPAYQRLEYLSLPRLDPRVAALAKQLATPRQIEQYLRKEFTYTLELPSEAPEDPLANFLFERRKGHCEYFASAMAVLLRLNGVPSRVITGFQSGTFNPISGWQVIRATDAHSWVEAWIEGPQGGSWMTFDPTPSDPSGGPGEWRGHLNLWADAMETFWRDWVLNYTLEQQVALAGRAEQARFRFGWNWLSTAGAAILKVGPWIAGAIGIGLLLRRVPRRGRRKRQVSEAGALYQKMLDTLKRRGIEKPPWMTPNEFAAQLPDVPWRTSALAITDAYYKMRFGTQPGQAGHIRTLLKQL